MGKITSPALDRQNNLGHQVNRLETFQTHKWIYDENDACSPSRLSYAGFYAITAVCARCHYCQKEMEWDATDIPWEEHKAHCPQCPFIKFYSSPPNEVLVIDAIKLEKERLLYDLKLQHGATVAAIEKLEQESMAAIQKRLTRKGGKK